MNHMCSQLLHSSKEYQLLIKNIQLFKNKSTILSGIIPYQLCYTKLFKKFIIYLQYYNLYKIKSKKINKNIIFNNFYYPNILDKYQQLIYFWGKNKKEVKFQLTCLLSFISYHCHIYIVGKNKSGINGINNIFDNYLIFKKIDYARNCSLYKGYIIKKPKFLLKAFVNTYKWNKLIINSLPGVFGYKKIDEGTKLLISTFKSNIKGKVLDIGSGTGILGIALAKKNPKIDLTLIDNYDAAIWCSKNNLINNHIKGKVFFSNIYSKIKKKYNLIISNPPLHNNLDINLSIVKEIIKKAKNYLIKNGELRIIIQSFISLDVLLKKKYLNYKIILKKNNYIVLTFTL
ncbi:Ribosomal RNA small subunit methyltransferase C [Buchnera aphidicola (Cinara piceae)]|uniref:Ribosomal RNA small subunit methyltransferase C n=1 Tax=Buchnera aphidicola (Cinara piceae) TaxID=1660043 RepID=A0A803FUP5_9GAMM|nr:16S rRNA (guanine(1207)-N(2))-methyltransferase RsmC [Buchnera aphidicola]VFP88371.1 Ribosomal RNA small subunit methyltransferase C [Buchnera aphidicola (Cinara piceae)]